MTYFSFSRRILVLASVLSVGACAYAIETSNQDIMFLTPGAYNAECDVYVEKIHYSVNPPQKLNVIKSKDNMQIRCLAPGNREIKMEVEPSISKRAIWGGPAGVAWDYASEAMFYYPSVVAIDFSHEKVTPNPLPKHNAPDILQPESHDLEEFSPGVPMLNRDKTAPKTPLLRRGEDVPEEGSDTAPDAPDQAAGTDKGSLMSIIKSLNTAGDKATPTESDDGSTSDPLPIFPDGEQQ